MCNQASRSWMDSKFQVLHVATPSGAECLSLCRILILDHSVDQEAAKLLLLCLNNPFSLVKEVWHGLATKSR